MDKKTDMKITGTEDREQLARLGDHFARAARGEVKPPPSVKPPGFTWGFTAAERAALESARRPDPKPGN